jgi:hypothetical protein
MKTKIQVLPAKDNVAFNPEIPIIAVTTPSFE